MVLPIKALRRKQIWIYRYALTFDMGNTFMLSFIGARAKTWKQILDYSGDIPQMMANYSQRMNFPEGYTWDRDQHIVSYAILKSQLCSLPKDNKLWKELNLEPKYERACPLCDLVSQGTRDFIIFRSIMFHNFFLNISASRTIVKLAGMEAEPSRIATTNSGPGTS